MVQQALFAAGRWLYIRLRPAEGWLVFLVTVITLMLLPWSLLDVSWVEGTELILGPALLAILLGWWLGRGPRRLAIAVPLAAVYAVAAPIATIGRILPPWTALVGESFYALSWVGLRVIRTNLRLQIALPARIPYEAIIREASVNSAALWQRFVYWYQGVQQGGAEQDNLIFLLFVCMIACAVLVVAAWGIRRSRLPLAWLAVPGLPLAANVFFAGDRESWALVYAGAALLCMAVWRFEDLRLNWERQHQDYSDELVFDTLTMGVPIILALVALAPLLPLLTSSETTTAFWNFFSAPWRHVETSAQVLFPELERPARSPIGTSEVGLPRAHLLGGALTLQSTLALRIRVSDPSVVQAFPYWRATTYERYTGRGWTNDLGRFTQYAPGASWLPDTAILGRRREVLQAVTILGSQAGRLLYAAAEPVGVDRNYQVQQRGPGDLETATVDGTRYTVLSLVPNPPVQALQGITVTVPADIQQRYLQLTPLSDRLRQQVLTVTVNASTSYDKALAIQDYLRQIPYSLNLPTPPPGRDLVDWFVFDERQGYCDYYASAMVVMARSAGIPARLAVGYRGGEFDQATNTFTVREIEAHSWPELYFPGSGWIPFEPTAAYQPISYAMNVTDGGEFREPESSQGLSAVLRSLSAAGTEGPNWLSILAGVVLVVGLAILAGLLVRALRRRLPNEPERLIPAVYARLERWGRAHGEPARPGQTPSEFAAALARRLPGPAAQAAQSLAWRFVNWRYGAHKPSVDEATTARHELNLIEQTQK